MDMKRYRICSHCGAHLDSMDDQCCCALSVKNDTQVAMPENGQKENPPSLLQRAGIRTECNKPSADSISQPLAGIQGADDVTTLTAHEAMDLFGYRSYSEAQEAVRIAGQLRGMQSDSWVWTCATMYYAGMVDGIRRERKRRRSIKGVCKPCV